ncbi:class I SAM-dependent methyltransferase [Marinimicrobium agarilyticum]|uniref:class I SAM-dependent methyltransferase n=1 Tax=Marinimicrobium agarilyticum TaxID=306546 RepID=UPI0004880303|nr:class I SAM-dependent methyltransferase [Marinimicrobium agarilyticum]
MKESKEFWDKGAHRYAKSRIRDEASYQKKLAITQEYFQPDWSVLEFGCGTGSTALIHAPHVKQIVATDLSGKMLEIAQRKARDANVKNVSFQQGTLDSLDFEAESFNAVLGLNVLHLIENVDATLSSVHGLLKPGGIFVSSTALVGELSVIWRLLIPLMQLIGLAPYVNRFGKEQLVSKLTNAGFSIDREWQPGKASVFIVAKKQPELTP